MKRWFLKPIKVGVIIEHWTEIDLSTYIGGPCNKTNNYNIQLLQFGQIQ